MVEGEIYLIRVEADPKDLRDIFSLEFNKEIKNPIPIDSKLFCVEYKENIKKLCLYFLSENKGFLIEEDFVEQYKNRISAWDLFNK